MQAVQVEGGMDVEGRTGRGRGAWEGGRGEIYLHEGGALGFCSFEEKHMGS